MGCEQGGVRPILVIQNNIGNQHSPTVIVAAITSQCKKELPTHVPITGAKGINKRSVVLLEQIRTIDRYRLREWVGTIDSNVLAEIDEALKISVGLAPANLL